MISSVHQVANRVLCCVRDGLVNGNRPEIQQAYVAAGQIAWDNCCGMLVVAPERVYRTQSFPAEATEPDQCQVAMIVVELLVLVVRCVPTVDDRGRAPSSAALDEAYKDLLEDAAVVWNSVLCCDYDDWDRGAVSQTFVGAEGGCVGVETRVVLGLEQQRWMR